MKRRSSFGAPFFDPETPSPKNLASSLPPPYLVMNVFPLILSLAWIIHRISSSASRSQRSSGPTDTSHLWSRCYDDLGCVNNSKDWYDGKLRPIKDQPLPRHIIKTTFMLFNKGKNPGRAVDVETFSPITKQIRATNFDENKSKTHLLIHDFTSNGIAGWIKHAVKSLLDIDAGNVISVDWTAGAEPPYSIAVQNARVVALEVAALLKTLLSEFPGINARKFHLIGQGVGAHIAGYVGQEINGIGRITGLDPVGLYFKDMPPRTRLDPKDAKFVDVINTDIERNRAQGSGDPYGHFNFFPNGGQAQIGCNSTSLYPTFDQISRVMLKEGETAPGCNHKRAAKYFTATIDERNSKCTPTGYACKDYSAFKRGECTEQCEDGSTCSPMGYSADVVAKNHTVLSSTNFFLDTNDHPPYCMFAYRITIALAPGDGVGVPTETTTRTTVSGTFSATVFSFSEDAMFRGKLNLGMGQKPLIADGDNVFLTYQKHPGITRPEKMSLRFEPENNETTAYVRHVEISNLPDCGNRVTKLCGKDRITSLKNHAEADFTACDERRFNNDEPGGADPVLPRQRRNPEEKSTASRTLDESEYDESEPPEPAEDDYYSNR